MIDDKDILSVDQPPLSAAERLYLPQIIDGMRTTIRHFGKTVFKGPITVQYPEQKRGLRVENYRGVHRLNRDEKGRIACVACFMCSTACPADCIHIEAGESPWDDREKYPVRFDIDELRCIYCGMCEEACPVDAIELTPEHDIVGRSREEMILDKEELLAVYDKTASIKPRKNPRITGYPGTGNRQGDKSASGRALKESASPASHGLETHASTGWKPVPHAIDTVSQRPTKAADASGENPA